MNQKKELMLLLYSFFSFFFIKALIFKQDQYKTEAQLFNFLTFFEKK